MEQINNPDTTKVLDAARECADPIDSDKEFNERLCEGTTKAEKFLYQLQQQMVEIETRFLNMEAKLGMFDYRFGERCKHIEDIVNLYRKNIQIFDKQIERAQNLQFKLVEVVGNYEMDDDE